MTAQDRPESCGENVGKDGPAAFLPDVLPIFPLTGALLLPGANLPLNIFEPRYLNMIEDSLGSGRHIGMVQPRPVDPESAAGLTATATDPAGDSVAGEPPVYDVGCAGRIVSFAETDDGRFTINLLGICRFATGRELPLVNGYRSVVPDFSDFKSDLEDTDDLLTDRTGLLETMMAYFAANGIDADWETMDNVADQALVTTLAMLCPFAASERQALLECRDVALRGALLGDLMTLSLYGDGGDNTLRH